LTIFVLCADSNRAIVTGWVGLVSTRPL